MITTIESFMAVFFFAWTAPEGHPIHDHLDAPEASQMFLEVLGFSDAQNCEDFVALAQKEPTLITPEGSTSSMRSVNRADRVFVRAIQGDSTQGSGCPSTVLNA